MSEMRKTVVALMSNPEGWIIKNESTLTHSSGLELYLGENMLLYTTAAALFKPVNYVFGRVDEWFINRAAKKLMRNMLAQSLPPVEVINE